MTQVMHDMVTIRRDMADSEFAPGCSSSARLLPSGRKNLRFFYYIICVFLMMVVGAGTAWGQTTYQYYCLHKDGKGYMKQYKGIVGNEDTFRYNTHDDNGSSMWVYSSDNGYLQQEMYYLNVLNGRTLVLSTTPVSKWDLVTDGDKKRLQLRGTTKILGLNDNTPVLWEPSELTGDKKYKYSACTLTVTENKAKDTDEKVKWEGPKDVSWEVQSPQLVTYLRAYYLRNITVKIDKNDAGTENVQVVDKKDSRAHCSLTYDNSQTAPSGKGTNWDFTTTGVIYNLTTSQKTSAATYTLSPLDPIVLAAHPATTATVTIKVNAKALVPDASKKYLLFSTQDGNYRFPKTSSSLLEDDLLPVNGKQSDLTEAINGDISWVIEVDDEGFYSFKNVTTGRYIYYDATDYTVSDYGAVKMGSTAPDNNDTRYKFRLYSNAGSRDPFGNCLHIIPYDKQFAVWKSNGALGELYFALYMNTSNSTKIASIYKTSDNAKWKIYAYEWEYRLWDNWNINGDQNLYATGDHTYTASTWFSRNIKGSPTNAEHLMLPGSKTHDGITYTWELTGLTDYISTTDVLASGTSTLTATVNSLPPGTRSGSLKVTAKITSPANISNNKTIPITLYNLTPTFSEISSLSQIIDAGGLYKLTADNTYSDSNKPSVTTFSGTLDGGNFTISGLSTPLFETLDGGTVRNVNFDNVSISSGNANGDAGAVCGEAKGLARIYNVGVLATTGSSVSGSRYVGGLVGLLDEYARVINCFSYANITGGSVRAGIVGYNNYASTYNDQRTMVMNCMFYGDISDGGTIYPVFGGKDINNYTSGGKLNTYNYYLYEAPYSKNKKITATSNTDQHYNHALAAEEKYLNRFEFYRNLLNSTRELAAWYVTGNPADGNSAKATNKMLKWVLDKSVAPYPILKEQDSYTPGAYTTGRGLYPSVVNYDPDYTFNPETGEKVLRSSVTTRNQGGKLTAKGSSGSLSVTINESNTTTGGQTKPIGATVNITSRSLPIIDKDVAQFNFNYGKVQLPYYNEVGTGNYTKNKVVTGWKITTISGGTNSFTTTDYDAPNYNFADRDCTDKDKYSVSGRVFSQGAYFDVPNGVSSITIEPYWGNAAYLSDEYYDCCVKDGSYSNVKIYNCESVNITGSKRYNNSSNYSINGDDQPVYTSFTNALTQLNSLGRSESTNVYDNAVVLVGNHHLTGTPSNDKKPYTIMSADLNFDNEPDYSFIFRSSKQEQISPIRFDFINVPGMAMAHKVFENNDMGVPGNFKWRGWCEITNTCMIRFPQFEYDSELKDVNAPLILLGGIIDQIVSTNGKEDNNKHTIYIHLGSNVYFPLVFSNGCHTDKSTTTTPHRPISVTGGDYKEFYLTGYLQPNTKATTDNAECYISGGRFGDVAGAGQEQLNGNVNWFIDHADIENFYGGGINDKNPITGNITTVIKNSHVDLFCGGPQFGDMARTDVNLYLTKGGDAKNLKKETSPTTIDANRTVSTTATDCTFGTFFGAGYGGTSLFSTSEYNDYQNYLEQHPWNDKVTELYTRGKYDSSKGIQVGYHYRNFEGTRPMTVGMLFIRYASLSLAQTNNVTSSLTGCTVTGNFYGGGSLGKVKGIISSTLKDCTINGNVFGAGFSAQAPTADVFPQEGFNPQPKYNKYTGVFEEGTSPIPVPYTWDPRGSVTNDSATGSLTDETIGGTTTHWIHVDASSLSGLGVVEGDATLTLSGSTTVAGDVFGGGDESAVTGSTTVNIKE